MLRFRFLTGDAGWSSPVARWAHNPKVAGSNPAPATNITDRVRFLLRSALRGSQHLAEISDYLQQRIAWWNYDLVEEPAKRLARGVALLVVFQSAASVVAF